MNIDWDMVTIGEKKSRQSRTNLIPYRIAVYNVDDVEGMVNTCADRYKQLRLLNQQEREEIVSEGICILFDLARKYDITIGTFSGYCSRFLPLKMISAWYKLHPEHMMKEVPQEDGTIRREYIHGEEPWSLDSLTNTVQNSPGERHENWEGVLGDVRIVGDFVQ